MTHIPLSIIIAKQKDPNIKNVEIKQYLCVNIKSLKKKGLFSWFSRSNEGDCSGQYVKCLKQFYEGLQNCSRTIKEPKDKKIKEKESEQNKFQEQEQQINKFIAKEDILHSGDLIAYEEQKVVLDTKISSPLTKNTKVRNEQILTLLIEEEKVAGFPSIAQINPRQKNPLEQIGRLKQKKESRRQHSQKLDDIITPKNQIVVHTQENQLVKHRKKNSFTGNLRRSTLENDTEYEYQYDLERHLFQPGEKNDHLERYFFKRDLKGLVYTNEEVLKKQRGVLGHFLKQMGLNLMQGKSIMNVSMPIKIFDSKSFLNKHADIYMFGPHFFEKAADVPQTSSHAPLERFKWIVAYAVATRHLAVQMRKPFNPILGETFQAKCGRYNIGVEQISHHPPILAFSLWSEFHNKFYAYGSQEIRAELKPNSVIGYGIGSHKIYFEDGTAISLQMPKNEVSGLMYGDRAIALFDSLYVKDEKNNLYAELVFNPDKKSGFKSLFSGKGNSSESRFDYVEGVISNSPQIDYKSNRGTLVQGQDFLCEVKGFWTEELYIDNERFWHYDELRGFPIRPVKDPLPSDCNLRQDLSTLKEGNEDLAQEWKDKLEVVQRNDKKLREAAAKRRKKNKNK